MESQEGAGLTARIASDEILDAAYAWLVRQRADYAANNDVWRLRQTWDRQKPLIQLELLSAVYRFQPVERYPCDEGAIELWSARDSLVLKAISLVLTDHLAPLLSDNCYHLVGRDGKLVGRDGKRGGAKAAIRTVMAALPANTFVLRSDVKSYYASMDHRVMMGLLRQHIDDEGLLILLYDAMQRTVCQGGVYLSIQRGISLGCALSPLLRALYLSQLDARMAQTGLTYARFMDDWVVLAPTRWKLRKAIQIVNRTLDELKVEQHPDKTYIGRISAGFDFLGYHLTPAGLAPARQTLQNFLQRIARLYEQGADSVRIGQYVRNWLVWLRSGLTGVDTLRLLDSVWMCFGLDLLGTKSSHLFAFGGSR